MWLVYLLAVILGGGILLLQVLTGKDHGPGDVGHAVDDHAGDGPGLLSTRAVVYALFTFGLVGGALHIPGLAAPRVALALAVLSGLAAGALVSYAFRVMGHPGASGSARFEEARGRRARVLLPCTPDRRGKIRVHLKGHHVDMMALSEDGEIPEGREVVIVDVRDDVARVREGNA